MAANGNSGEAVRHSPDLFAQQVDDLLVAVRLRSGKILKKEAEEERLVLVGASMGGMIATQYAAVTPSAIKRLVLIGPAGLRSPPRMNGPDLQFLRIPWLGHLAYLAIGEKEQLKHIKERQLRDDDPKLADQDPQLLADITSSLAWQVKCKPGFLWDIYRDLTQMPWGGMQDQAEAVGRHGYPVELIWGSEDVTIPISFAEMWQGRIPRAKLTTIDGAGHSPYLTSEHMDVLVDTILPPT